METESPFLLAAVSLLSALQMGELNKSAYILQQTGSAVGVVGVYQVIFSPSHITVGMFLGKTLSRNCTRHTVATVHFLENLFSFMH